MYKGHLKHSTKCLWSNKMIHGCLAMDPSDFSMFTDPTYAIKIKVCGSSSNKIRGIQTFGKSELITRDPDQAGQKMKDIIE